MINKSVASGGMIFSGKNVHNYYLLIQKKFMNSEEKDIDKAEGQMPNNAATGPGEDQSKSDPYNITEDDLIRNETIPKTSKDTPGSNGAFPVGAFDTSKD
jgi:hypothetical protein